MIKEVMLKDIKVDARYQRELKEAHLKKMTREYDPIRCGVIAVSKREDGSMYVIDGNHRIHASKANGVVSLPATVYEGLSVEEEADLFAKLNTGSLKTGFNENLKAMIMAGNEEAVRYESILEQSGISYSLKSRGDGSVNVLVAHSACMNIMRKYGQKILLKTLSVIKESCTRPDGRLIQGLAAVLTYPDINIARVTKVIRTVPFMDIVRTMMIYSTGTCGSGRSIPMAKAIATYYNKGMSKNRIDLAYFDQKKIARED